MQNSVLPYHKGLLLKERIRSLWETALKGKNSLPLGTTLVGKDSLLLGTALKGKNSLRLGTALKGKNSLPLGDCS